MVCEDHIHHTHISFLNVRVALAEYEITMIYSCVEDNVRCRRFKKYHCVLCIDVFYASLQNWIITR